MMRRALFRRVLSLLLVMPALALSQPAPSASSAQPPARSLLSSFMAYTDLRVASVQRSLEVLSATTEVQSGQWPRMKSLLGGYEKSEQGLIVWYVRPDGSYYTVDRGLMSQKLSDRAYFPALMAGRKVTAALVVSRSTGQRSAVIAVPLLKSGKVMGAVGVSLFLDQLSDQVSAALELPSEMSFFALAPDGLTTLHRKSDRHFLDPREMGSETLKKAADEMLSGSSGEVSYQFDNATKHAVFRTSPLTQWRFAITFSAAAQK